MVIVDVRAVGGRGDTGIPTDAYFAVEEIRDVSLHDIANILRLCDAHPTTWVVARAIIHMNQALSNSLRLLGGVSSENWLHPFF